jgi:PAS domain S-box-containing protein
MSERQRADALLQGFLEAAPDAIVGVDSSGCIALVNGRAERLFGYTHEELVGKSVELLGPEAARAIHPPRRARSFADPEPVPMGAGTQVAARRRGGSEFPVEIILSSLVTPAGIIGQAVIRDVSERLEERAEGERLQREFHQSQRLEKLGQLAGGIAHDFNNLIAVIVNYAAFVHDEATRHLGCTDADSGSWQMVRSDVEQIELAGERASQLTHRLLAFARREVVRPEVMDVNRVVREVEKLLRNTIGEHVELGVDLPDQVHAVLADRGQIEQVLLNLAINARNAMPTGGTLTLDTEDLVVDDDYVELHPSLTAGLYVRLRVSDTGSGMTPEVIERAFEPFFTTKPQGEGTGLGLASVHGIISQANGHVYISSEPGLGTTVTVLLPAIDEVGPVVASAPVARGASHGETILVVDDEDAIREVTRRILSRSGYEVLTAANGEDALAIVGERGAEIHMVISDVIMPKMLGKEVAEKVHAMFPDLPVLFMSGYAQPILTTQGTLDPGVTLVEKPFSELVLLTKVRETLDAASCSSPQGSPVP